MLEKSVVIALVLNYLGVVAKSMTMYDLYHGLSVTVKVGKKNYTVDSEKIAFLRSIGINVDVEIEEGGCITLDITLPYENKGEVMDVECEDIAKLLCEFFKGVSVSDRSCGLIHWRDLHFPFRRLPILRWIGHTDRKRDKDSSTCHGAPHLNM